MMSSMAEVVMDEEGRDLLAAAEHWSEEELEGRCHHLLRSIHVILDDREAGVEDKMDCVHWLANKLVKFVPVFEAEESIFSPLLTSIIAFLNQVFQTMSSTEELNKAALMSVAAALLEHVEAAVLQAGSYEGLGPGDIPSLPRLVPKILCSAFRHCLAEQEQHEGVTADLQAPLAQLFCKARTLLDNFLGLMERMRIRSVLEDERDIVIQLCADLVSFHKLLVTIDLKSSLKVWHLYCKLAKEHADRLRGKLDVETAIVILLQEGVDNFKKLETCNADRQVSKDDVKKINRSLVAVSAVTRLVRAITDCYRNMLTRELDVYLEFVGQLVSRGRCLLPRLVQHPTLVDKLKREVYTPAVLHHFVSRIAEESVLSCHLTSVEKSSGNAFLCIYLMLGLLEKDPHLNLLDPLLQTYGLCLEDIHREPELEGLEVPGVAAQLVDNYEWVLTRLCSIISAASPLAFVTLEEILLRNILRTNCLTSQLTSDIWCFIARYGSSKLCLQHLVLLCSLYQQLDFSAFSVQRAWLGLLIGRLFNFLAAAERHTWADRFPPADEANLRLWTLVDLSLVAASVEGLLTSLANIVAAHLNRVLIECEESQVEYSMSTLVSSLQIMSRLVSLDSSGVTTEKAHELLVVMWQKLAHSEFVSSPSVWLAEVLGALGELTRSLVGRLTRQLLHQLLASLRMVVVKGLKVDSSENSFLVHTALSVVGSVATLDWISDVDDVESCVVEELANLCCIVLRETVREPLLKTQSLLMLRQLAEKSNNAAFIKMCADEEEVMPHFELFLQQDNSRGVGEDLLGSLRTINEEIPELAEVVNAFCAAGNDSEVVKRSFSKPSLSPKRKKHKVQPESGQSDDHLASLIERLEEYSDIVFEAVVSEGCCLSEANAKRLAAVGHKISATLPQ